MVTHSVTYKKCLYRRENDQDIWGYLTTVAPDAAAEIAVFACPLKTIRPVMEHTADALAFCIRSTTDAILLTANRYASHQCYVRMQ